MEELNEEELKGTEGGACYSGDVAVAESLIGRIAFRLGSPNYHYENVKIARIIYIDPVGNRIPRKINEFILNAEQTIEITTDTKIKLNLKCKWPGFKNNLYVSIPKTERKNISGVEISYDIHEKGIRGKKLYGNFK